MLSDVDTARTYLQAFLPDSIKSQIDLNTLRITDNSFLTDELSGQFADLVLECKLMVHQEVDVWISFLYEHKSYPEKYSIIQVGQYVFAGYRKQVVSSKTPLKLIIPVLYYHGVEVWEPGKVSDLFTHIPEDFTKYLPEFDYLFQNINLLSESDILNLDHNLLIPGLLMQKYYKDLVQLKKVLYTIFFRLSLVENVGNYKRSYFVYLFDLFEVQKIEIMKFIEEMEYPTKDRTKNYILQLMDEGIEKGMEKGMEKSIIKLLQKDFTVDFICNALDVPKEIVLRLKEDIDKG